MFFLCFRLALLRVMWVTIKADSSQNMSEELRTALSFSTSGLPSNSRPDVLTTKSRGYHRIEKTCLEFLTLFLQVLDEGRLTDGKGRLVDFRQVIQSVTMIAY